MSPLVASAQDLPAAEQPVQESERTRVAIADRARGENSTTTEERARAELLDALERWVAATNARDLAEQMAFYPERVPVFYLWRDASRAAVRAEKRRVIGDAERVDIKVEQPQIIVEPGAHQARMYFRKQYVIRGDRGPREGEVLQELRWENGDAGWRIVGERDLTVLR
jgi:ketosteroid isomerase-like protein